MNFKELFYALYCSHTLRDIHLSYTAVIYLGTYITAIFVNTLCCVHALSYTTVLYLVRSVLYRGLFISSTVDIH
jgi:hypothetical protein